MTYQCWVKSFSKRFKIKSKSNVTNVSLVQMMPGIVTMCEKLLGNDRLELKV